MQNSLLQLFPLEQREFWKETAARQHCLQEIRLRCDKPIVLLMEGKEYFLDAGGKLSENPAKGHCIRQREIESMLNHICHYSLYAFEEEIRQGFITVQGGHRVGIAGQVVLENTGNVRTIKNISYVNIRISHEIPGVADEVLPHLYNTQGIKNTLIISPPGCGKTTLLRDLIRQISDGNSYGAGMRVGVVDERSEIAGCYQGTAQNDVGMRTDVLDACPKALGMMLLLRSMSPQVLAIDELGGEEDMQALQTAAFCGSRLVATMHGMDVQDVIRRLRIKGDSLLQLFDCFLILGKVAGRPVIKEVLEREDVYVAMDRRKHDYDGMSGAGHLVSSAAGT